MQFKLNLLAIGKKINLRAMTLGLIPVAGLFTFWLTVNAASLNIIQLKLPILQGVSATAYFIFFCFVFASRRNHLSNKYFFIIHFFFFLFLLPYYSQSFLYYILLYFLASSLSYISYLAVLKKSEVKYLCSLFITSTILPITLLIPEFLLCLFSIIFLFYVFRISQTNKLVKPFSFNDSRMLTLSFLCQLPIILYPILDSVLIRNLPVESYRVYALYLKFVLGLVIWLFNFTLTKLMFTHTNLNSNLIVCSLFLSLFATSFLWIFDNYLSLFLLVSFVSITIGFTSYCVRVVIVNSKKLEQQAVLSLISSLIYVLFLIFLYPSFANYPWIFLSVLNICLFLLNLPYLLRALKKLGFINL